MDNTIQNHRLRVATHNFGLIVQELLAHSDEADVIRAFESLFKDDHELRVLAGQVIDRSYSEGGLGT